VTAISGRVRRPADWKGSTLVRDVCIGVFALTGVHAETTRLLYPNGMPRHQVEQCNEARRRHLATGELP